CAREVLTTPPGVSSGAAAAPAGPAGLTSRPDLRQEGGSMPTQVVNARIRGFICLNAHPEGCAANVRGQVDAVGRVLAQAGGAHARIGDALGIGSSTGYGRASLITTVFGYGARAVGVCLERAPQGEKTASAGWYNLAAV